MTRYVRSKYSEAATRFRLTDEACNQPCSTNPYWLAVNPDGSGPYMALKSEYIECEPPVVWTNVTSECFVAERSGQIYHQQTPVLAQCITSYSSDKGFGTVDGYRRRKIHIGSFGEQRYAFIVEKREEGV